MADAVGLRPWTVPNAISVVRLLGVPAFLWLLLVEGADAAAVVVIAVAGATDWLDGWLARRLDQRSRLGELLDPLVDRLYILSILVGMCLRGMVPWWVLIALVLRDAVLAVLVNRLRTRGILGLPVTFLGKTATFLLLWGFPFVLAGSIDWDASGLCLALGWALVAWGGLLYAVTGVLYARQAVVALRAART